MKLCIPVSRAEGLESVIEPHLPDAEHLLFFDTDTRLHEHVSLRDAQNETDERIQMDAVLCGSINRVTLRMLMTQGIKVYGTEARVVAQAISQFENGDLVAAVMGQGGQHGQAHGHQGGCCSGQGHGHGQEGAAGCGDAQGTHQCGGEGGGCGGHGGEHDHQSGGCCGGRGQQDAAASEKPRDGVLRIAVSSQNRKTVTEHAGKCRKFWVYEVIKGQVAGKTLLELPIEQSLHEATPGEDHPLDTVNVLISASMGSGLKERLLQRGIQGVVTQETDPDQAVALLLSGEMELLPPNRDWVARCAQDDGSVRCGASGHPVHS
jgi:predicted Fe-Mo cluster-binding NifX family protein